MNGKKLVTSVAALFIAGNLVIGCGSSHDSSNTSAQVSSSATSSAKTPNYELQAKEDLEKYSGQYVTDFSIMNWNTVQAQNGNVTVDTDVKLDGKDQKHHVWAIYTKEGTLLRIKLDSQILYNAKK